MAAPLEVIISSDSGSQLWNSTVFDLHSGSSLLSYRGGNSSSRALTVLGGQYLLSAQLGKNFINVWEIQRKVRFVKTHADTRTQLHNTCRNVNESQQQLRNKKNLESDKTSLNLTRFLVKISHFNQEPDVQRLIPL